MAKDTNSEGRYSGELRELKIKRSCSIKKDECVAPKYVVNNV